MSTSLTRTGLSAGKLPNWLQRSIRDGIAETHRQDAGSPWLAKKSGGAGGDTNWQLFEVGNLKDMNLSPGDAIQLYARYTFKDPLNDAGRAKTFAWGFAESPAAAFTQFAASTRQPSGERTMIINARAWVETSTLLKAHTSLLNPFGNSTNAPATFAVDLSAQNLKLYVRGMMAATAAADATEYFQLEEFTTVVTRRRR